MNKKIFILIFIIFLLCIFFPFSKRKLEPSIVNIYTWYDLFPKQVIKDFEQKTGIKVVLDFYDSNDMLEAKLLATKSGYDLVFPSFMPYAARQDQMKIFQKLNFNLIENIANINGTITEKFKQVGGDIEYILPIFWDTIGIIYNKKIINKIFASEDSVNFEILFDPEKIKKLAPYGVSFSEEYIDIFPQLKKYLQCEKATQWQSIILCARHMMKIRQYIKKFSSGTMINDLFSGEICIAIGSSDNAWKAMKEDDNIAFILPEGYGFLAIECAGIPLGAPNVQNAHKFLNYILRPDVAAKITNHSGILVNSALAYNFFDENLRQNEQICPKDEKVLQALLFSIPNKTQEDRDCDKEAIRIWLQVWLSTWKDNKDNIDSNIRGV